jgi:hypothetical protein
MIFLPATVCFTGQSGQQQGYHAAGKFREVLQLDSHHLRLQRFVLARLDEAL